MEQEFAGKPLGFALRCLTKNMDKALKKYPGISSAENMTGTHAWILGFLHHHKDQNIFQKDVEKVMEINRSTATGILQLMEKNGLIYRESVPEDARLKKICLTEKAESLDELVHRDLDEVDKAMVKGMTQEEVDTLMILLSRLKRNLDDIINE